MLFRSGFDLPNIPILDFLSRPRSSAEKFEARIDRWIEHETTNLNLFGELLPSVTLDESLENFLQRDSVKRIFGWCRHEMSIVETLL